MIFYVLLSEGISHVLFEHLNKTQKTTRYAVNLMNNVSIFYLLLLQQNQEAKNIYLNKICTVYNLIFTSTSITPP